MKFTPGQIREAWRRIRHIWADTDEYSWIVRPFAAVRLWLMIVHNDWLSEEWFSPFLLGMLLVCIVLITIL